jgi:hypothetical protein
VKRWGFFCPGCAYEIKRLNQPPAAKEGSPRKNCASENQQFECDMLCPIQQPKWKSWLKKGISHDAEKHEEQK